MSKVRIGLAGLGRLGKEYAQNIQYKSPNAKLNVSGDISLKGGSTTELSGDIDPAASTTVTGTSTKFTTE